MKAIKVLMLSGIVMSFFLASTTDVNAQETKKEKTDEQVFLVVQDMPEFQNGDLKTFQKWVGENVKYPKGALKNGITGTVYCDFVIQSDGTVDQIKITESVHKLLDEEVIRVVKSSPKWTPGKQKGKNVAVKMSTTVSFKLS